MKRFYEFLRQGNDRGLHIFNRPLGLVLVVAYKALLGVFELGLGTLVYGSARIIANELAEDPQDLLINWILSNLHPVIANAHQYGALIIFLGVVKLGLAFGLWQGSRHVRPAGLIIFGILGFYGTLHLMFNPSYAKGFFLLIDILILFYFWKVLPKHIHRGEVK